LNDKGQQDASGRQRNHFAATATSPATATVVAPEPQASSPGSFSGNADKTRLYNDTTTLGAMLTCAQSTFSGGVVEKFIAGT
jgi:hypothetical protein